MVVRKYQKRKRGTEESARGKDGWSRNWESGVPN
jgi:hypothetical protein